MRNLCLFLALSALSLGATALAGTEVKLGPSVEVATPPAVLNNDSSATATVRDQRRLPGQTLRCWQFGRLVYEAGGFRGAAVHSSAIAVPRAVEGEPVTVFNLNDGMCILSSH